MKYRRIQIIVPTRKIVEFPADMSARDAGLAKQFECSKLVESK